MCRENKVTENCCGCGCCDMVEEETVQTVSSFDEIKSGLSREQRLILEALNFLGEDKETPIAKVAAYQKENHALREELAVVKGHLKTMADLYCTLKEVSLANVMIDELVNADREDEAAKLAMNGIMSISKLVKLEREMVSAGILIEANIR